VAAISSFLFRHGANITDFDQHTSEDESAVYFTRLEFQTDRIDLPLDDLEKAFALDVARPFSMDWRLTTLEVSRALPHPPFDGRRSPQGVHRFGLRGAERIYAHLVPGYLHAQIDRLPAAPFAALVLHDRRRATDPRRKSPEKPAADQRVGMEPTPGLEPGTYGLRNRCSTD
jgi:hypothetical protein